MSMAISRSGREHRVWERRAQLKVRGTGRRGEVAAAMSDRTQPKSHQCTVKKEAECWHAAK
jgi:hypothetical protein